MAATLFIFCPFLFTDNDIESTDAPRSDGEARSVRMFTWGRVTGEQPPPWQHSTLRDLPAPSEDTRVCVVLPGEQVLLTQVTLKGKKARHLQQALPYLVEENLAADIESMHIVSGTRQAGDQYPVAAIDTQLLEQTLALFRAANIGIDLVIPDTLLLPWNPGVITLYLADQRCLLRYSAAQGLAIDSINLAVTLESILQTGTFDRLHLYYAGELEPAARLQLQALQTEHAIEVNERPLAEAGTSFLSLHAHFSSGINLLQGKVALDHRQKSAKNAWRPLLTAAAILLGLSTLYDLGTGLYLNTQAESLYQQSEALYRQYFPEDKRVINIRTQTEAHLRRTAATAQKDRFLLLMGKFGQAWKDKLPEGLSLQQLRFDKQRGQLIVDVEATSIQQLEQFRQQLAGQGLNAELLSANEEQQQVRGRLQLTEAG